eukprot:gene6094-8398_t
MAQHPNDTQIYPLFWGISVLGLISFIEIYAVSANETSRDINKRIITKETTNKSWCEQYYQNYEAEWFVSYRWDYSFLEVVRILESKFKNNLHTIVWLDLFSINQHFIKSVNCETNDFKTVIEKVKCTLTILAHLPDDHFPTYKELKLFQRSWCIYEIYKSIEYNCKIEFVMSEVDSEALIRDLHTNPCDVMKALSNVDSKNASVSPDYPEAKDRIDSMIDKGLGHSVFNRLISKLLITEFVVKKMVKCITNPSLRSFPMLNLCSSHEYVQNDLFVFLCGLVLLSIKPEVYLHLSYDRLNYYLVSCAGFLLDQVPQVPKYLFTKLIGKSLESDLSINNKFDLICMIVITSCEFQSVIEEWNQRMHGMVITINQHCRLSLRQFHAASNNDRRILIVSFHQGWFAVEKAVIHPIFVKDFICDEINSIMGLEAPLLCFMMKIDSVYDSEFEVAIVLMVLVSRRRMWSKRFLFTIPFSWINHCY